MENGGFDLTSGRVLGPLGVVAVFVVIIVIARGNAADPNVTATALDFTSGTSVTLATTTSSTTTTTTKEPPPDTSSGTVRTESFAAGWQGLHPNNLAERRGFTAVGAGDRMVVWGGVGPIGTSDLSDGASYLAGRWTPIAPSRIVAGIDPVTVWTGSELFVFSTTSAAWNPSTKTWRELAFPPTGQVSSGHPIAGVWMGDELLLIGYRLDPPNIEDNLFLASYGPALQCCKSYPDPPFSLTYGEAFWTGDEMLLIGALLDPDGNPMTDDGLGRMAGFDPTTETWTEYGAPPLTSRGLTDRGRISAAWTGAKLIAFHAGGTAAEWTKDAGWRSLPEPPMLGDHCRPRTAAVGDDVFAMVCGQAAVWSEAAQRWYSIRGPDTVAWSSTLCIPVVDTTASHIVQVWCSLDPNNAFWRIDLSKVEATRYSESAILSQWELLPNPAATRLDSTAMVWSGEELLYFSGHGVEVEELRGWGYDPETNTMHGIPDAPNPGRTGQVALWTGDEMLIQRGPTTLWNPITLEWRTADRSPALNASPFTIWTGEEAIFYGSRTEPSNIGAAYDPDTDTWRTIPIGPAAVAVGVQVMVWSGEEVYVLGNRFGGSRFQSGARYNPETDQWRPLPRLLEEYALSGSVGGFVDGEFIVVGVNGNPLEIQGAPVTVSLGYSPKTDTWRTIAPIRQPTAESDALEGSMAAVAHGEELAVYLPGAYYGDATSIAFYRPSTDTWRYVDGAPASAWGPPMMSGDTFVAYLTSEGTVLLHDD